VFVIIGCTIAVVVLMAWFSERNQRRDSDEVQVNIKQSRQDLRLITFLLMAVVVLLAIIADKLH
jgi:ABC-type Fe3+ transport system permease subunit